MHFKTSVELFYFKIELQLIAQKWYVCNSNPTVIWFLVGFCVGSFHCDGKEKQTFSTIGLHAERQALSRDAEGLLEKYTKKICLKCSQKEVI